MASAVSRNSSESVKHNYAPGCGRSFRAITRFPAGRPTVHQPGQLGRQPRLVTLHAVGVVGRGPRLGTDAVDGGRSGLGEPESDRIGQALAGEVVNDFVGAAG